MASNLQILCLQAADIRRICVEHQQRLETTIRKTQRVKADLSASLGGVQQAANVHASLDELTESLGHSLVSAVSAERALKEWQNKNCP